MAKTPPNLAYIPGKVPPEPIPTTPPRGVKLYHAPTLYGPITPTTPTIKAEVVVLAADYYDAEREIERLKQLVRSVWIEREVDLEVDRNESANPETVRKEAEKRWPRTALAKSLDKP